MAPASPKFGLRKNVRKHCVNIDWQPHCNPKGFGLKPPELCFRSAKENVSNPFSPQKKSHAIWDVKLCVINASNYTESWKVASNASMTTCICKSYGSLSVPRLNWSWTKRAAIIFFCWLSTYIHPSTSDVWKFNARFQKSRMFENVWHWNAFTVWHSKIQEAVNTTTSLAFSKKYSGFRASREPGSTKCISIFPRPRIRQTLLPFMFFPPTLPGQSLFLFFLPNQTSPRAQSKVTFRGLFGSLIFFILFLFFIQGLWERPTASWSPKLIFKGSYLLNGFAVRT